MRAASLSPITFHATMQGQRVLTEHFYVVAAITPPMLQAVVEFFGHYLAATAREIHLPHWDTGDTWRSIMAGPVIPILGGGAINVSAGTEQARFLEFGFVHHATGQWIFNPFMIPAADVVAPQFYDAVEQIIGIASNRRFLSGLVARSDAQPMLASVRGLLYAYSKWAGDIQALGFQGLSRSRGFALKGAQGIGNIQAFSAGTGVARALRVGIGRAGGSLGRSGVVSGFAPNAALSGPSARIYNRIGGRAFGGVLSGVR